MTLPRFSLRLLLLAVAVLCACLAWERSVVMERRAAIRKIYGKTGTVSFVAWDYLGHRLVPRPRWTRRLFGDDAVDYFDFSADADPVDLQLAAELFPEARILRQGAPLDSPLPAP